MFKLFPPTLLQRADLDIYVMQQGHAPGAEEESPSWQGAERPQHVTHKRLRHGGRRLIKPQNAHQSTSSVVARAMAASTSGAAGSLGGVGGSGGGTSNGGKAPIPPAKNYTMLIDENV